MMTLPKAFAIVAIAIVTIFATTPLSRGATAAGAGIEVDGKYIGGYTITRTAETREELVKQLAIRHLTFERDFTIPVDADNPNQAKLVGTIRILSKIRGDREIRATIPILILTKREGNWYVDEGSLKQALKSAKDG